MITEQSSMRRQLAFAIAKLSKSEDITISAYASNISKAIRMAEIIKLRVSQLH
jgi:DNA-binding protein